MVLFCFVFVFLRTLVVRLSETCIKRSVQFKGQSQIKISQDLFSRLTCDVNTTWWYILLEFILSSSIKVTASRETSKFGLTSKLVICTHLDFDCNSMVFFNFYLFMVDFDRNSIFSSNLWSDQVKWVVCRQYLFWDT